MVTETLDILHLWKKESLACSSTTSSSSCTASLSMSSPTSVIQTQQHHSAWLDGQDDENKDIQVQQHKKNNKKTTKDDPIGKKAAADSTEDLHKQQREPNTHASWLDGSLDDTETIESGQTDDDDNHRHRQRRNQKTSNTKTPTKTATLHSTQKEKLQGGSCLEPLDVTEETEDCTSVTEEAPDPPAAKNVFVDDEDNEKDKVENVVQNKQENENENTSDDDLDAWLNDKLKDSFDDDEEEEEEKDANREEQDKDKRKHQALQKLALELKRCPSIESDVISHVGEIDEVVLGATTGATPTNSANHKKDEPQGISAQRDNIDSDSATSFQKLQQLLRQKEELERLEAWLIQNHSKTRNENNQKEDEKKDMEAEDMVEEDIEKDTRIEEEEEEEGKSEQHDEEEVNFDQGHDDDLVDTGMDFRDNSAEPSQPEKDAEEENYDELDRLLSDNFENKEALKDDPQAQEPRLEEEEGEKEAFDNEQYEDEVEEARHSDCEEEMEEPPHSMEESFPSPKPGKLDAWLAGQQSNSPCRLAEEDDDDDCGVSEITFDDGDFAAPRRRGAANRLSYHARNSSHRPASRSNLWAALDPLVDADIQAAKMRAQERLRAKNNSPTNLRLESPPQPQQRKSRITAEEGLKRARTRVLLRQMHSKHEQMQKQQLEQKQKQQQAQQTAPPIRKTTRITTTYHNRPKNAAPRDAAPLPATRSATPTSSNYHLPPPPVVKKSDKKLTVPQGPNLSTTRRSLQRSLYNAAAADKLAGFSATESSKRYQPAPPMARSTKPLTVPKGPSFLLERKYGDKMGGTSNDNNNQGEGLKKNAVAKATSTTKTTTQAPKTPKRNNRTLLPKTLSSPLPSNTPKRPLTVPQGPKLSLTAKYGDKQGGGGVRRHTTPGRLARGKSSPSNVAAAAAAATPTTSVRRRSFNGPAVRHPKQ